MIFVSLKLNHQHICMDLRDGIFYADIYENGKEFLRGEIEEKDLKINKSYSEDSDYIMKWWKPKAIKRYTKLFDEGKIKPEKLFYGDIVGKTWKKLKIRFLKRSWSMNIFDFTKEKDSDKEYPYKILVYPNITYMRDLEKDSYVVVLRNVINKEKLNKVRDDIHWTIMSPADIKSLTFENTTQIPINLPSYPNAMRCHFNYNEIK